MKNKLFIIIAGGALLIICLICYTMWTFYNKAISKNSTPNYCYYDAKKYSKGESFKDMDDCNTCKCGDDLQVSCTKKYCESNSSNSTNSSQNTASKSSSTLGVTAKCFRAVIEIEGTYKWKDSCAGTRCEIASKIECSGDLIDLTADELKQYTEWVSKESPQQEDCDCYLNY